MAATKIFFRVMTWNIENFGLTVQNGSSTVLNRTPNPSPKDLDFIADIILSNKVDIVLIQEVYINGTAPAASVIGYKPKEDTIFLIKNLLILLNLKDQLKGSNNEWKYIITGANCTNSKMDSYLYLYRTSPNNSNNKLSLKERDYIPYPTISISKNNLTSKTYILTDALLNFQQSRHPAGIAFQFNSEDNDNQVFITNFHNYTPSSKDTTELTKAKDSLGNCLKVTEIYSNKLAVNNKIIGGDFNLNYLNNTEELIYNNILDANPPYKLCNITSNYLASTLIDIKKYQKSIDSDKYKDQEYRASAYDNFFYSTSDNTLTLAQPTTFGNPDMSEYTGGDKQIIYRGVVNLFKNANYLKPFFAQINFGYQNNAIGSITQGQAKATLKYLQFYKTEVSDHLPVIASFILTLNKPTT